MNTILQKRIEEAAKNLPLEDCYSSYENGYIRGATEILNNQWISVEEALPEKSGQCGSIEVFVICIDGSVGIDYYDYSRKNWRNNNCVTNWMYIPELKGGEE